jgi:RNA polymerase sigma-70 factor, ECF subfamily
MDDEAVNRNEILERLRERIFRFAASRIQKELAEDLAQEVLIVLHEKYAALDRVEDLLPVSLEIARLKILAARRKMVRRGEHTQAAVDDLPLAVDAPDPFEQTARREQLARLESILKSLGARCRELMRLKLQGYSFPEIQKRLKASSLNAVYTWDFRCRQEIRARWSEK